MGRLHKLNANFHVCSYDYVTHILRFSRALRSLGMMAGPTEISASIKTISSSQLIEFSMDRPSIYWILRSLFVRRNTEIALFDEAFEKFWSFDFIPVEGAKDAQSDLFTGGKNFQRNRGSLLTVEDDSSSNNVLFQPITSAASSHEINRHADIAHLGEDEISEIPKIARKLVRKLADRPGRRYRRGSKGRVADFRNVFRLNIGRGGEPVRIPMRIKLPKVPRIIILIDVSGSMNKYTRTLLQLAFELCKKTSKVKVFVFSTSLTDVTKEMCSPSLTDSLRRISNRVSNWSGGTRIGDCLEHLRISNSSKFDRYTTVVLMSDGWDTNLPEEVVFNMRNLRRLVRKIIWLNPLLGSKDYEQATQTLKAVEPFVDVFASARNIASLRKLPDLLV